MSLPVTRTLFMRPGFLCLPSQPTRLCTIIASGVAVTVYDRHRCQGGVGHYSHPLRIGRNSSADFAAPALVGLIRMFTNAGSDPRHLETYLYGGADNPDVSGFSTLRGLQNIRIGYEILDKLGVRIAGTDVGGRFARKLIFYTSTGESMLAKVTEVEDEAWYPPPSCLSDAWQM